MMTHLVQAGLANVNIGRPFAMAMGILSILIFTDIGWVTHDNAIEQLRQQFQTPCRVVG
jgi:hypothetical protein